MERNTENVTYGKSLQEIRKKNNLTQEQVSQLTGLETKYISQQLILCLNFVKLIMLLQMTFYINLFKNQMLKKILMNMKRNL